MGALIGLLIPNLAFAMGYLIVRLFLALGIGFVTYLGFDTLMTNVLTFINTQLSGTSASIAEAITTLNVPQAFTIITAAITTRITINGLRKLSFKALIP